MNASVGDTTMNRQASNEEVTGNISDPGMYFKMQNILFCKISSLQHI